MRKTPLLRYLLVVLIAALAPGCERKKDCADCEHGKHLATPPTTAASQTVKTLQPWETFNEGFNGCAGGCGMRVAGPQDGVVAQPGALVGQRTYCPVSGVAFVIKATSAHRTVGDKTLYFCCETCAAYFTANQAQILAARGITA